MAQGARYDEVEPGHLLGGKYLVEAKIGEGGMGIVHRAVHVELDRRVAIKVVREELAQRNEVVRRLLLEARAAASIRSEHVARVLDIGRAANGAPYIVMEYLEGRDLCEVLEQYGRLQYGTAIDLVLQACEAVGEAHARGIVHRDLKPENLFLTTRADGAPVVKVLDFGIAKSLRSHRTAAITNPSATVGSPHYMAPEQMRARDAIDHRADIWSLGAILYELVTGRPPFDADTIPSVCVMVLSERLKPARSLVPELPEALDEILARCLAKRPSQRFENVAELAEALAPFGSQASLDYAGRVSRVVSGVRERTPSVVPPGNAGSRREATGRELRRSPVSPYPPLARSHVESPSRGGSWLGAAALLAFGASLGTAFLALPGSPAHEPARAVGSVASEQPVTAQELPVNVDPETEQHTSAGPAAANASSGLDPSAAPSATPSADAGASHPQYIDPMQFIAADSQKINAKASVGREREGGRAAPQAPPEEAEATPIPGSDSAPPPAIQADSAAGISHPSAAGPSADEHAAPTLAASRDESPY
jgi:serine/threonine-protein kinase